MKTAIFYTSKYGTTRLIAQEIGELISAHDQVTFIDVADCKQWPVSDCNQCTAADTGDEKQENTLIFETADRYVVGVPVYAGKPHKPMQKFCDNCGSALTGKPLHLFVCGIAIKSEDQQRDMEAAFPEQLRSPARQVSFLGGALQWKKMNFMERIILAKITGKKGDQDHVSHRNIKKFAEALAAGQ